MIAATAGLGWRRALVLVCLVVVVLLTQIAYPLVIIRKDEALYYWIAPVLSDIPLVALVALIAPEIVRRMSRDRDDAVARPPGPARDELPGPSIAQRSPNADQTDGRRGSRGRGVEHEAAMSMSGMIRGA